MDELDSDFYLAYGRAMGSWAELERSLCLAFTRIAEIPQPLAWSVFYSARSLQGRVEMLQATIPHARTLPAGKDFLTRSSRLVSKWAGARNRLAHDPHAIHVGSADDPGGRNITRFISSTKTAAPVQIDALKNAARNFSFLAMLVSVSFGSRVLLRDPELSLAGLDLAPADPFQTGADLAKATVISMQLASLRT